MTIGLAHARKFANNFWGSKKFLSSTWSLFPMHIKMPRMHFDKDIFSILRDDLFEWAF